ncbi:unnamed protein product [Closterium sp. NIES-53]
MWIFKVKRPWPLTLTCTDLGELRSYLGLQITRDRAQRTITLTHSHMVHQVLQRFGFQYSSPQPTPLSTNHSLSAPPSDESVEPSGPYPELVSCLMYLMTCTRPDLAYSLSLLARYVAPGRHREVHWDAAKRVLRYLCSTSGMGLVLGGRGPVVLTGHADASWVDDSATQRSSQGYTFSLGSGSVSWRSTRSSSVLSSSCEAEIYAGAMTAQELRWLTYLLTDLGEQPRSPLVLYIDNKAMIALCQEHRLEHRTKHIALRYFLARELQQRGQLRLAYVATRANTADVFTKALPPGDHQHFVTLLLCFASSFDWSCDHCLLWLSPTSPMGRVFQATSRVAGSRCAVNKASIVAAVGIEKEVALDEIPLTLLKEGEVRDWKKPDPSNMRARFENLVLNAQDSIIKAIEEVDGKKFRKDAWMRPGGGGGISGVLQNGNVWEKAGVNVSVVYGTMPREAYRAATGESAPSDASSTGDGRIPFFACGISSVMHPWNPFAPTMHFNYRYFETDAPAGVKDAPRAWWFGGGTDITPSYLFEEDMKHFHGLQKEACDKIDTSFHPQFKKACDDYFLIKHRGERRGCGGIFYDDMNQHDPNLLFNLAKECSAAVVPAYVPLVVKRKDTPYTEEQKQWQQLRRGRYVEFNLVYDRGTTFGLKTGGRIESILMSLPLTARWEYNQEPAAGTPEAELLDACRNPREWV